MTRFLISPLLMCSALSSLSKREWLVDATELRDNDIIRSQEPTFHNFIRDLDAN